VRRQIRPDLRWAQEEGTDVWAVHQGCLSISPLRANLTSRDDLDGLRAGAEGLFASLRGVGS
jgi:broad specificity polyphosphatase/5'/3'-nucleotidase SurE